MPCLSRGSVFSFSLEQYHEDMIPRPVKPPSRPLTHKHTHTQSRKLLRATLTPKSTQAPTIPMRHKDTHAEAEECVCRGVVCEGFLKRRYTHKSEKLTKQSPVKTEKYTHKTRHTRLLPAATTSSLRRHHPVYDAHTLATACLLGLPVSEPLSSGPPSPR